MKTLQKIWALTCCLVLLVSCTEVKKEQQGPAKAEKKELITPEQEMKAVEAAVELLREAIVSPDTGVLDDLTADELSYGHSNGTIQDRTAFTDDLVNGAFDFTKVDFTDQQITVSGHTAVVRHIFEARATHAGEPVDIRIGNMLVYVKKDGKWKLLARQAYKF
ncbi:nuclear transport factor 2 family protein [Sinomicrobium soli]|uniref:nuclear transport factor 2 family protein n=1 Tax=Sinomicrobium sp. N-1-3-6 TaxID=2219864 RepID=UPI000DCB5443|nr:nuclear transport factor 2 family protein [Sinomicrobium sp. N-1-3-6]RAV30793.1 nuclear transport factor 2 family protein [Sinomicrobium sp. N-1-3-6]